MQNTEINKADKAHDLLVGTSRFEGIIGIVAAVFAILGLFGYLPYHFAAVAALCIGAGLLIEGGGIAFLYRLARGALTSRTQEVELIAGATVEMLGGAIGLLLAILSLLGFMPFTLLAVATLVYGVTLVAASGASMRVPETQSGVRRASTGLASVVDALIGLGAIVAGILLLAGDQYENSMTVLLAAFLAIGCTMVIDGAAIVRQLGWREIRPVG